MLGAWIPILTFQNLDPYGPPPVGVVSGGTCTRADLATNPSTVVRFGVSGVSATLALSTSCDAPFGYVAPRVEVPEC